MDTAIQVAMSCDQVSPVVAHARISGPQRKSKFGIFHVPARAITSACMSQA